MLELITTVLLVGCVYLITKLEHKVNELQDEVHALHHSLDVETEALKDKISYIEKQNGQTV